MPIKIPDDLPAKQILQDENIFIMGEKRAFSQDIRPLKIIVLNLMPNKVITEVQLLRLLGNSPLQIDITLMHMESHVSKNTTQEYLFKYYNVFSEIKDSKFDGMIITGAPIEHLEFEEVTYWEELTDIMEWTNKNVTSTLHICWGAQAGLFHHYGINKYPLDKKMFGIFKHNKTDGTSDLLRGYDDVFYAPHSRHTTIKKEDIEKIDDLKIVSCSKEAGIYIVESKDKKNVFVTGHSEYDYDTLKIEYERDLKKNGDIEMPVNYFKDNDPLKGPVVTWKAHSNLLFINWLNYYVYQITPYDFIVHGYLERPK